MLRTCALLAVLLGAIPTLAASAPVESDSTAMDWSQMPEYRIVPGDKLNLNFGPTPTGETDLVREVRVRPDGRISVFPVGDVIAAGRTPRELELALVELLAADLKNPRVTVDVSEIAGNSVHVMGDVNRPGSYEATPFMTLSQAIATAGGFGDTAARNSVLVFHRDGARTVWVTRVRLDRALKRGSLETDPRLSRFDIVFVPRSSIGNLDVFARQFFGGTSIILTSALTGWELFNLDRVFVAGKVRSQ